MRKYMLMIISVLLAALSLPLTASAQEKSWLPAPTGPYQVGTTFYHWVDKTRDESFTDEAGDKRELVVRLLYPAEVKAEATPVTYLPNGKPEAQYFAQAWQDTDGIDVSQLGAELAQLPTHSYRDAPISGAEARYPVLIYSPGLFVNPETATAQLEQLASNGYIVAAIYHTYVAGWVLFPDGRVVFNIANWRPGIRRPMNFLVPDAWDNVGALDQIFVLDQLRALNDASSGGQFSGRLNLDRVGTFGASWGAWQAAMASFLDARFKAALIEQSHNLFPSPVNKNGLGIPVMIMDPMGETTAAYQRMKGPAFRLILKDLDGWKLGDFGLWPGFLDRLSGSHGSVTGVRAVQVVNAYTLAFFDHYLKGKASSLLAGPASDYPEAQIISRNT